MDRREELDGFLAGVERRALYTARLATRNPDDALDLVQDAMTALVSRYADRPAAEWAPLFHRILQNRIRDWSRRRAFRDGFRAWLGPRTDAREERDEDPIQTLPDRSGAALVGEFAIELGIEPSSESDFESQLQALLDEASRQGRLPQGVGLEDAIRLWDVFESHCEALSAYEPRRRFGGRSVFLEASEARGSQRSFDGWGEHFVDAPEVWRVAGDHRGVLQGGAGGSAARIILEALEGSSTGMASLQPIDVANAFRIQAEICRVMESKLYSGLLVRATDEVEEGGELLSILGDWQGEPESGFLALRLLAAVHACVLDGSAPELAKYYPTVGGDKRFDSSATRCSRRSFGLSPSEYAGHSRARRKRTTYMLACA